MAEIANKKGLIAEGIEGCTDEQVAAIYDIMVGKTSVEPVVASQTEPPVEKVVKNKKDKATDVAPKGVDLNKEGGDGEKSGELLPPE